MYNYLAKITSLGNCLLMLLIGMFTCKPPNLNCLLQPREISKNNSIIFSIHLKKKQHTYPQIYLLLWPFSWFPNANIQLPSFLTSMIKRHLKANTSKAENLISTHHESCLPHQLSQSFPFRLIAQPLRSDAKTSQYFSLSLPTPSILNLYSSFVNSTYQVCPQPNKYFSTSPQLTSKPKPHQFLPRLSQ